MSEMVLLAIFDPEEIFNLSEDEITKVLPKGYKCRRESTLGFKIVLQDILTIGHCELTKTGLLIKVSDDKEEGHRFWLALAVKYPLADPRTMLYGIVCEEGGLYYLSEVSTSTKETMKNIDDLAVSGTSCYLVQFMQWHLSERHLKVLSMRRIMPNGGLGNEYSERILMLGSK